MKLPFCRRHDARGRPLSFTSSFFAISSLLSLSASAITFKPAPPANLDLSQLGRVTLIGDFSGVSLFEFEEQNERPSGNNGSQSLLARLPNRVLAPVVKTDASIQTMCAYTLKNGSVAGVVLGGNFTSLGDLQSTAIALFNPNTSEITPLSGLSGQVNAVLCDQNSGTVYVGGNFAGANSTNAIAWVESEGFRNLPFAGFNGPVTSITKAANGHIIFGGSFTGLGNASTPSQPDGQVINLSTAKITAGSSTTAGGFSDPKNIVCKTSGADGAGNTWLLQDQTPGFWQASFNFGFQPTKLRLWNTHQDGRGTKTWRFTALPINGILNFTYIDLATGGNASCTNECPLSDDPSKPFQDFHFVNSIGMNAFRLDISAFYGNGGGLDGIELFGDDIFAYAINDFNEPACAGLEFPSTATATGPWVVSPSQSSTSEYLSADLSSPITESSASIVFSPDIRESGHYSVNLYTPGCIQDNTCSSRGQFVISGQMTADPTRSDGINQTLFQTNNFDKYDQIYFGQIDASSGSFRPTVTMTPVAGQSLDRMTFVAQRVGFTRINSTGGLNGLFEYDPTSTVVNTSDFSSSIFNKLGSSFSAGSAVNALATSGDVTFVGGNFTSTTTRNIVAINPKDASTKSLDGGLNGAILSMYLNGTNLFVGGIFSSSEDGSTPGLNNVAVYDTSKNSWSPLGSGVDGRVLRVVPLTMNVTSTTPEVVISVTGDFKELRAFDKNPDIPANGFGIWVPSQNNWLRNLDLPVERIEGILTSSILDIPGGDSLYAGSISSSSTIGANGVVTLGNTLGLLPVQIEAPSARTSGLGKRDTLSNSTLSGVVTGAFDQDNNRNVTILAGHFTAKATNGSEVRNLVFIDGSDKDAVTGLGSEISEDSAFVAIAVQGDVLFAGGNVTGTVDGSQVHGLIAYNLATKTYSPQPPALSGGNATVSSIAVRPGTGDVYVGGSFLTAGSLPCPGVCYFSTNSGQWKQPGQNLEGTVNTLMWASDSKLLAGGNLTINDTASSSLAVFDVSKQSWDSFPGSNQLPGPVDILTPASKDGSRVWVAGTSSNGSVYLMKYDGSQWNSTGQALLPGTNIRSLQMFSLKSSHDSSPLLDSKQALMLTGSIVLPNFGSASAVLFNGVTFEPFALTTGAGNGLGSIAHIFSEKQNFFTSKNGNLPLVFIVLIGLGISLGLMLLLVVAGLFLDRLRKKREGYVPAPTSMYDRGSGIQRIPPEELLGNVGRTRPGAPQV
ncbi:cortical protein marker for cell polarity-domain-containing protein [Phialemonium atrogriseum]|uniref:Cortical protein marker for cell polarity-domain-containing protein n=1 Tax=Phialemonium atrogriseum TaxID=1093897 RepID=A0AAJ0BVD5_9PEZI|nr:cortical protein marker for cell polarity-domain-containing protein [Phialemonium atrogriseum]KAK1764687.1 cortical protein marker for cell polarity-domain-containing protein [Phialemonium atrogriseum]